MNAGSNDRPLWRSLEEARGTAPPLLPAPASLDPLSRRGFLNLLGGSLGLAGLGACTRQPREEILPYAKRPEDVLPGEPLFFATALPFATGALGLLVESHDGRPTKAEGNPDHPASLGATDALAQASVLDLVDPDRSEAVTFRGRISTWDAFETAIARALEPLRAARGAGLRVLSRSVTSPTLARQRVALLAELPEARWHVWEPVHRDSERAGARLAFGEDVEVRPHLDAADVVLAIDADFLGDGPRSVRLARDFADRRRVADGVEPAAHSMNRLYALEPRPTLTGALADHRLALGPAGIERFVRRLAERLGARSGPASELEPSQEAWLSAVADDLAAHRGSSLVLAGRGLSPGAHALVHAINAHLENVGRTLDHVEPVELESQDHGESVAALVEDARAGRVEVLVVLEGNPVYDAPADLEFAAALREVPLRIHLGQQDDETAVVSHWHVPAAHFLEAWSDARAQGGEASIVQPLIAPLYSGHTAHEVVALLAGRPGVSSHDLVRDHWREVWGEEGFDKRWRRALHDGVVAGSSAPPRVPEVRPFQPQAAPAPAVDTPGSTPALELVLYPDESAWDGRYANNAWLQELPRPISKLTWDNAAMIGPATAQRLGVESGDVLELRLGELRTRAAAWILPGVAADCVALSLGYGRERAGAVGAGAGFDAYRLRSRSRPWTATGLTVEKTGERHRFATTQTHSSMEGRDIVREVDLEAYRSGSTGAPGHGHGTEHAPSLYPAVEGEGNQWGMVIDLNACIGCNACTIACQAENNIPVVGKEEVDRGRAMHWIRVDRYFAGEPEAPETRFQPVTCMHCENAPCELVCPVNATVHGPEGLNEMVYNRCVGTRYCSNNCPYKVRRFNFLLYSDFETESLKLQRNPDVTVRSRGVMEKCTYCVQRINEARITARTAGRSEVADGEVRTACQQVCPTRAITFGDVSDPATEVSRRRGLPQHYGLLEELNTRPRTTYLARLTHRNPALEGRGPEEDAR